MPYPISHTPAPGDEDNNNNNNNDDNVVSKASGEAAEQRADQTPTESAVAGSHQPAYRLPGAEPSGDRHSDAIGMAKARAASPAGDTADTEHRHPPGTDSKPASEHGHGPDTDPTAGQVAAYRPKRKILLHAVVWIVATTYQALPAISSCPDAAS